MSSLKICHLDTERSWRGGEQQLLYLAKGLRADGHQNLIVAREGSALSHRARLEGFELGTLHPRFEWDPIAAVILRRLLIHRGCQILHAHSAHAAALGALATLGTELPLIASRRVDFHLSRNPLTRWKYRRAKKVIAVSLAIRDILVSDGLDADHIAVIHDGVDPARLELERPIPSRKALGLPESGFLIGQIAALAPHKDPFNFLKAMALLKKTGLDVYGVLVGDGPLKREVFAERERLGLSQTVCLLGFQEKPHFFLRHFDLFVLSSCLEGLGTSILDAFAAGIPVVATRTGGIPEAVEDGVSGLLVPPRDARALAQAMEGLIQNPSRRDLLRQGGLEAVKRFTAQAMVEKTIAIYQKIR